ncbi:MAG: tRNA glutamyl-Q(34) synthetase GluQRS [Woeseiaceae bacterium]|nr:tRNA glutamyl-Q(34) synthetase GluQRS [Woeseiaceae bacterium]
MSESGDYVGRFAPSPTGPLHFGSLLAAVASYLEARHRNGRWLVRIEDMDPPREQPGADRLIVNALEHYGFEWDDDISYQGASADAHREALDRLAESGLSYHCNCSRKDLADAPRGPLGIIYPGTCRAGCDADEYAVRVRTTDEPIGFEDRLQGRQEQRLETESGDFVVLRRDGLVAYHLAVVVDDHLQGITDIVRGIDLMDSTPRQIWLQRCLGLHTPTYAHIPVAVHADGSKLSKLTGAPAIPLDRAVPVLVAALAALGQSPPDGLDTGSLDEVWKWAIEHWQLGVLRGKTSVETVARTHHFSSP